MKQPIKMTPGDELHLTALMAPFSLNLVTGQDRQHLLGYGRSAFEAGLKTAAAAEQAAWHAGLDEGRAQAAPAAVAVPDLQDMLRELRVQIHKITTQLQPTVDCSGVWMAHDKMSAALAATPAADAQAHEAIAREQEACALACEALVANATDWDSSYWDKACIRCALEVRNRKSSIAGSAAPVVPEPETHLKRVVIGSVESETVWEYQECAEDDDGAIGFFTEQQVRALLAGVSAPAAQAVPPEWDKVRRGLTMLMLGFSGRPDCTESAAEAALDAATEPGMPLASLRILSGAQAEQEVHDDAMDWDQLPEDPSERAMFDRNLELLYGGDPRIPIATSLRIWANTRGNGSFGLMCAILANEVAKLHIAPQAQADAREALTPKTQHTEGWVMVPVKPTDAMIRAGEQAENNDGKTYLRPAWRYMLAAAPKAESAPAADALDAAQIRAAAKELTKRLDFPWEFMTDEGRESMCENVRCAFAAALSYATQPPTAAPQAQADARDAAPAASEQDAPITWPKARDVGRFGDMSPTAFLRVGLDSDNDVYASINDGRCGADIEFCTPGAGGGKSSRTRLAMLALMVAMEADNADDPGRDWWGLRGDAAAQAAQQGDAA